jgi:hypothetical protein
MISGPGANRFFRMASRPLIERAGSFIFSAHLTQPGRLKADRAANGWMVGVGPGLSSPLKSMSPLIVTSPEARK